MYNTLDIYSHVYSHCTWTAVCMDSTFSLILFCWCAMDMIFHIHAGVVYWVWDSSATTPCTHIVHRSSALYTCIITSILVHLVYINWVVCQTSYAYSLLMRANKLETAMSRDCWLFWPHHDSFLKCTCTCIC